MTPWMNLSDTEKPETPGIFIFAQILTQVQVFTRFLCVILFLTTAVHSSAQYFKVTPEGLRDADDTAKTFLMIEAPGRTAKQLYDSMLLFIQKNYILPDQVISNHVDGVGLAFETYVPELLEYSRSWAGMSVEGTYTTEMKFYDGQFSYEVFNLDMRGADNNYPLLFKGRLLKGYIIYKPDGTLYKPKAKADIEQFFNNMVARINGFLQK